MKVLVCDDRPDNCSRIVASINSLGLPDVKVEGLCGEHGRDLDEEIALLFQRVRHKLGETSDVPPDETKFDSADLVFLDNNLAYLSTGGVRFTAESIIGYVRAFTSAGYIVSLNKNPEVDFDLRYLVGDYASRADMALNERHVSSKWLWTREREASNRFRPWYWPKLISEPQRRREQIAFVEAHLDDPIVVSFGFSPESIDLLSRHALGTLSPLSEIPAAGGDEAKSVDKITFRDMFLASSRAIPDEGDRSKLSELSNLSDIKRVIAQAVTSDVDLWIRRDIIGPQEVLVDVPHLLTRMPFILQNAAEISLWNKAIEETEAPFSLVENLFSKHLSSALFDMPAWSLVPCFWWSQLQKDSALNQLFYEANQQWADAIFCEDTSKFIDKFVSSDDNPREFVAEFEGPWERRYVSGVRGFKYAPRSRFAF